MKHILLLALFLIITGVPKAHSQSSLSTKITVKEDSPTVLHLFKQIEATNLFDLAYSGNYVDVQQTISIPNDNSTVQELLKVINDATHTTFRQRGRQIMLIAEPSRYTISGYISDAASGENLIGANAFEKTSLQGTSSNTYGFYSLTLPATSDSTTIIYSYVGYQPQAVSLVLTQDTTINITLQDNALLDEVVITASEADKIQEVTQMSTISVPIEQIKSMPAFLGEVDVLKTLQLLPGVQSGNEGTSGIYVRGGGPDQNLILLDGVPVYNASHLFGFFSVFNADAINNVQLIKGGFPARYGGRLSSVIDISMKEGNMNEFHGEGSIGLVASKLTLEGPILKGKTSFIVSGRRTYIDLLTRPLIRAASEVNGTGGYYFYDLNAKVNHRFSDKDRLYLSAYLGDDRFSAESKDEYVEQGIELEDSFRAGLNWGNITSALRWNHVFNNKLFSNLTLTYSRYRFNIESGFTFEYVQEEEKVTNKGDVQYLSGIQDFAAKLDFDFIPSPNHYIRYGVNAIRHRFNPGAFSVFNDDADFPLDTTLNSVNFRANEFAAYVEDDWQISNRLKVNLGLHLSAFDVGDAFYYSLQPRVAARYLLSDKFSLKASYARMTQFVHLLTNSGVGLPTDLWVPATELVPPQQSHQVALGAARSLSNKYEISLEGYYKTMDNVIEYKEGASFAAPGQDWQDLVEIGDGWSYGTELLLQKKVGKTTGWLGYTLSWTNRQFDNLNFGRAFPYKYDRRHDASIAVVHQWKKNREFSFTWVYGTGNAITIPRSLYAAQESSNSQGFFGAPTPNTFNPGEVYYYGERNSYRMAAYHRLDASVTFRKDTRWGQRAWVFAVYNAYSRQNPFFIYYTGFGETSRFRQFSLFPIIPSVSYRFEF